MNAVALRRSLPLIVGVLVLAAAAWLLVTRLPLPFNQSSLPDAVSPLPQQPAPDFHLSDENGQQVSMSQQQGKTVALAFIYTSCPDVCPLITSNFNAAQRQLGADAARVSFMAITVDPETDTQHRLAQYSQAMGMTGKWEFLTGTRQQLEPVWSAYWVSPIPQDLAQQLAATQGDQLSTADASFQGGHTAPVFLIDAQGRERGLLDPTFTTSDLVRALRAML